MSRSHSTESTHTISLEAASPPPEKPFSRRFFDKNNAVQRGIYLKIVFGGTFIVILVIFAVFSIFWGSLWKIPARNLNGWVIDFDGDVIGTTVVEALTSQQSKSELSYITWTAVPSSQFPNGLDQVATAVVEEKTWVAITIHSGASSRLQASYASPNASYDGSEAITVYGEEARNENAFRNIITPSVQGQIEAILQKFSVQLAVQQSSQTSNLTTLLATSPQTIVTPVWYTFNNLKPFDEPVAAAVTLIGLIYQLILTFFVVMICNGAREAAGLNRNLTFRSLIITRFVSSIVAYFFIALFYTLVSRAFQLDFSRKFGHSGFLVFWMLTWVGMMAVGLALESLFTLLTIRFIPFFLIFWIIANVSVCIYPIDVLPIVFRYGYAAPFYNVSRAVRTIIFGTKNEVGMNFGILLVWAAISCITLPLFTWFARRRDVAQATNASSRIPPEAAPEKQEPEK